MLRSLYSGVSGMRNNQTKMDVIGNNIANVSTTAFKSGRVRFQDVFSQTLSGASAPGGSRGGVNPRQVGLGMQIGGIDTLTNQGAPQTTGRPLDFYISGEGYFVVANSGELDATTGEFTSLSNVYTRDGSFSFDASREVDGSAAGYTGKVYDILNSDGYRVMGYINTDTNFGFDTDGNAVDASYDDASFDPTDTANLSALYIYDEDPRGDLDGDGEVGKLVSYSIETDGTVKAMYEGDDYPVVIGRMALAKFTNPAGLVKEGSNNYNVSPNSGVADLNMASEGGTGIVQQGCLEMSNVDLANEFTDMIITSRAFQANSRTITTSDEMLQELLNLKR